MFHVTAANLGVPAYPLTFDDYRDKTDAASSSGPSAVDPGGSACDTARSRPGLEQEKLLEAKLLCFFTIVFPNLRQVIDPFPPGGSSPRLEMARVDNRTLLEQREKLERQKNNFEMSVNSRT